MRPGSTAGQRRQRLVLVWRGAAALLVEGPTGWMLGGRPFGSPVLCLLVVCWDQKRLPWLFSFVKRDDQYPQNNGSIFPEEDCRLSSSKMVSDAS